MEIKSIILDIQQSIFVLQNRLDQLKVLDNKTARDVLITRKEASEILGVSIRQIDRYCNAHKINKIPTIQGVRISKREVLVNMGLLSNHSDKSCDFDRIFGK